MAPETPNEKPPGPVKLFAESEKLRNYAGAIAILLGAFPAVGSLIVSVVTAYRGEPVAEQTWLTLRSQMNKQADFVNKLHLRVVHMQAYEEGKSAAAMQLKLDELQKKYDQLKTKQEMKITKEDNESVVPAKCKEGRISVNGKCKLVSRDVAAKVKTEAKKSEVIRRELVEEKLKRLKEEKLRRAAEQKTQAIKQAPPLLDQLPERLEEASKRGD